MVSEIASYVDSDHALSDDALAISWLALFDAMGCAMASTRVAECMAHVGPLVPEMIARPGVHIPGTGYLVDPVTAAYSTGCLIRWLDFSDTWVALETGHPSDHIGTILAAAELESTSRSSRGLAQYNLEDVQRAMIIAYEIQGVLGLTNSLGRFGFDHAAYVRIGSAATATRLLGGGYREICSAVSHAWCDGHPLRIYRQAPNTGPRKSWAGPDASARGLQLAFRAVRGEPHCGSVLTDPKWGMEAVQFKAEPFSLSRRLGSYVMENILFKAAYPGVVHAQTALEAAIRLHPLVKDKSDAIDRVDVWSYETAIRITSKTGMLRNAADRDHCMQYLVAVGLLKGDLTEDDFLDMASRDEKLERLRRKIVVHEDPRYTASFLNPEERACANGVQVTFADGSVTPRVSIEQPLGHASRRAEGLPYLERKLLRNLSVRLGSDQVDNVMRVY
ncbi:MAG: 2-methylcitrate dehydratase, partial [Steroidobacteraceae bacterium]